MVAPGADPNVIRLGFEGADKLEVDAQGGLILHIPGGELRLHKPHIYQEVDGVRRELTGRYVVLPPGGDHETSPLPVGEAPSKSLRPLGEGHYTSPLPLGEGAGEGKYQISFQVTDYDPTKPLVIDPELVYSTLLGGSSTDTGAGIALDALGNIYLAGSTVSPDFPTTASAFDRICGTDGECGALRSDAFVTKLSPDGSSLLYSTFLGGLGDERGSGIALDATGNVYVVGETNFSDFPTTPGAFDTSFNGGMEAFVVAFPIGTASNRTAGATLCALTTGEPIQAGTGEYFTEPQVDLNLGSPLPLRFSRTYAARLQAEGGVTSSLGPNWMHNFDLKVKVLGTNDRWGGKSLADCL